MGSATKKIPMPTGSGQHDREQRHNIQKPQASWRQQRERDIRVQGLDWRRFFVTIWPDQGALEVLHRRKMYLNTALCI
jgi:hypothetical protein